MPKPLSLAQIVYSQGFGTRRECETLIARGRVAIGGAVARDPTASPSTEGLVLTVDGVDFPYHARALVLLHKPLGYECSQKPTAWPSVLELLPEPLRRRGVQPIGRLDQDTTGVLLLTDDGPLLHRLTSPKRHVAKVYEVAVADRLTAAAVQRLCEGVVLHDDPEPVRVAAAEITGEHTLRLTLTEGKYHQVRRMLAAVGNRVTTLHRSRFGSVTLPDDLAPGQWRWLDAAGEAVH